jgi:hypothetical protein
MLAIAILAILSGVAGLAIHTTTTLPEKSPAVSLRVARHTAVATARPVTLQLTVDGRALLVTAFPDGSVVADPKLPLDRLSGVVLLASRGR